MKDELLFCPLGGSGEIGMNMNLFGYGQPGDHKWIMVDIGVTFAVGAGLTKACGTAACATAVSGAVLKLSDRNVNVEFLQGSININWHEDNDIYMTGKVSEIKKIDVNI